MSYAARVELSIYFPRPSLGEIPSSALDLFSESIVQIIETSEMEVCADFYIL